VNAPPALPTLANIAILRVRHLPGPNHWTYRPVLEAVVDIGLLEDYPSDRLPGFPKRLAAWLPGLVEHRCSVGERGGFLARLAVGTWPAHIIEHVALELQSLAGLPTGFGRAREMATRGVYKVAIESPDETVATVALELARDLVLAAMRDTTFDVDAAVAAVREQVDVRCLGPGTTAIVAAAAAQGIPAIRLNDGNLVQLGYGRCQRRVWTAETDRTNAIAEGIARNRALTCRLLGRCGIPVPAARTVRSPAEAWEAAQELGLPVVLKPEFGDHGRGVCMQLSSRNEVEAAFTIASAVQDEDDDVEVQRWIPGSEHRLLVVGGEVVAALRGIPAVVIGDGHCDIATLVARQLNNDPRRGDRERHPLAPIGFDAATQLELTRQGFRPDSVPAPDTEVILRRHGNLSEDITDIVHPEMVAMALLAVRVTGLDIAGVDLVAKDIAAPLSGQPVAVIGVSAGPALQPHLWPGVGMSRPVGRAIVDHLFPDADDSRIPLVGIAGDPRPGGLGQLIADLMQLTGLNTGLADGETIHLGGRRLDTVDPCPWKAARQLLMNRSLDAAVVVTDPAQTARRGLPYDRCQVAVIPGFNPAAVLPDFDIESRDDLWKVVRTQVDVVLPEGVAVLNGDEAAVLELVPLCDGEVILFAASEDNPALAAHRRGGGRAAYISEGRLVLAAGAWETVALYPRQLQRALEARPWLALTHLLAAVGAAWALGITDEVLGVAFSLSSRQREIA
jgi:cyanophycin synthetase